MAELPPQKSIVVAVRTRPLSLTERIHENSQAVVPTTNPRVIKILGEDGKENDYTLDHTFWEDDTNETVYNQIGRSTLEGAFNGYNGTIFAYGQTGSGKTHTMMGGEGETAGIIPRLCKDIFAKIDAEGLKAEVRCSYVEIYGQSEKMSDLLLPENTTDPPALVCRQRSKTEYFVSGLSAYQPESATQMEMFIRAGSERRAVASTQMNDTSSRSHAVFIVELTQHTDSGARRTSSIKYGSRSRSCSHLRLRFATAVALTSSHQPLTHWRPRAQVGRFGWLGKYQQKWGYWAAADGSSVDQQGTVNSTSCARCSG